MDDATFFEKNSDQSYNTQSKFFCKTQGTKENQFFLQFRLFNYILKAISNKKFSHLRVRKKLKHNL